MTVFDADSKLPRLPLPELSDTCAGLKEIIRPLAPEKDYERVCMVIDEFAVSGKQLQHMLCAFQSELGGNNSWLRPFWDDSYLTWRGKLPLEMNYSLELRPEPWGNKPLASFILAICRFFRLIGTENLPAEDGRCAALSMDALRFMAYTRTPCSIRDMLYLVPLSTPARVAVVSKGCWFILTLSDASGDMLSVIETDKAIQAIRELTAQRADSPMIGAMTAINREDAALIRTRLLNEVSNRSALADIENCLFSVSLDAGGNNFAHDLLAGDAANRWFDKSLQVIASEDGHLGINLEHAGCDAGLWAYALNWIDRYIKEPEKNAPTGSKKAHFRALVWKTDPKTTTMLSEMNAIHRNHAKQMHCVARQYDMIDREKIKALGCGPDVFIQLAFQAAYYRLTKTHVPAYEAVSVRNFYHGRTECARPATIFALTFARLLAEDSIDVNELRQKLSGADKAHRDHLMRCQKGLGAERHLFGLQMMARMKAEEMAAPYSNLFTDPALLATTRNTLSTSSITGDCIRFFGFGPVVEEGLGLGYIMTSSGLQLTVTSLPDSSVSAEQFSAEMEAVIHLMLKHLA